MSKVMSTKQHWWMASGTVYVKEGEDSVTPMPMNSVTCTSEYLCGEQTIKALAQGLGMNTVAICGQVEILEVVIGSISYLGYGSKEDFYKQAEPVEAPKMSLEEAIQQS